MPNDATVPYDDEPEHIIIWLDAFIGESTEYIHFKKAFSSVADPKSEITVSLSDQDTTKLLCDQVPVLVNFEGVQFLLASCRNIEECIQCFERNEEKRIFFVTSGSLGRDAVPEILKRFQHVFTDPETDEPYTSIYIYCGNIKYHIDWALECRDYIQMFDHEADLLTRMTRDIAEYFLMIGKRMLNEDPPNNAAAYHRLSWANELFTRYSKRENLPRQKFEELKQLLDYVEEELKDSSDEDDD